MKIGIAIAGVVWGVFGVLLVCHIIPTLSMQSFQGIVYLGFGTTWIVLSDK